MTHSAGRRLGRACEKDVQCGPGHGSGDRQQGDVSVSRREGDGQARAAAGHDRAAVEKVGMHADEDEAQQERGEQAGDQTAPHALDTKFCDWGDSSYYTVTLRGFCDKRLFRKHLLEFLRAATICATAGGYRGRMMVAECALGTQRGRRGPRGVRAGKCTAAWRTVKRATQ